MTPKEAIELIEYELPFTSGIIEEALETIRICVEKQTPKKVILGYDEQDYVRCPQCKSEIAPMVELKAMRGAANSYKLENERLLQKLQQAKSDAIKEFAERLKNKIWCHPDCNRYRIITTDDIDDLAREMTEVQE